MQQRRRVGAAAILALVILISCVSYLRGRIQDVHARHSLRVVEIELGPGVEIRPVLARGVRCKSESFSEMVQRLKPYAAINGTFYSQELAPLGDILIDGKLAVRGRYANAIAVHKDGRVEFVIRKGRRFDWTGYRCALAAGPRLIRNQKIELHPLADGFKELSLVLTAPRSGIGLTKSGKLLLVVCAEPLKLREFAQMMLDLGAVEAMNLDGGPACGLYHNGKFLAKATLPMTNMLAVYVK